MKKHAYISGLCPFLDEDVTIEVLCNRYQVIGAPAYATITENNCYHLSECPYQRNCPVTNQQLLWDDL